MKDYLSVLTARIGRLFLLQLRLHWPRSAGPWPLYMLLGGLILLASVGLYATHGPPPPGTFTSHVEHTTRSVCAPFGGRQSFELEDRSVVDLDSGACMTTDMSAKARVARLESGEAIVQVARDPSRPFTVEAGPISILALGTKFDVFRKELSTRVAVSDGAVQVAARDSTAPRTSTKPLTTLQQLDVPDDTALPMVRKDITFRDFDHMTAWLRGQIWLDNLTLREALDEFARYQPMHFYFEDRHLEQIRFSGVFQTVNVDSFLQVLKLKCIHGEHDKDAQLITVTHEAGKRSGAECKRV